MHQHMHLAYLPSILDSDSVFARKIEQIDWFDSVIFAEMKAFRQLQIAASILDTYENFSSISNALAATQYSPTR